MRAALLLLIVTATLGLVASAVLAGMALAGAPLPATGPETLVVRLAVFPALLTVVLLHTVAMRQRTGARGAPVDGEDWSRLLVSAPAPLVLLQRILHAWVIVDFVRIGIAVVTGWAIAPVDTRGETDPWSIWVFLWTITLSLAVVGQRRTRPGMTPPR